MTCFWDGLIAALQPFGLKNISVFNFVSKLKSRNHQVDNVMVQGTLISDKARSENFEAVEEYDSNQTEQGYYCSTSDPFLILVSYVFRVDIIHNYNGSNITYAFVGKNPRGSISVSSNAGHFWKS